MTAVDLVADDTLQALIRDATAAPSMHNAQPWQFHYHRSEQLIEVRADPDRTMPHADPEGRALRISCGAALLNLRVSAWHAGLRPDVELTPDSGLPHTLARVRLSRADPQQRDDELAQLRSAIPERHTSRYPFTGDPLSPALRAHLAEGARRERAVLTFPTGWHLAMLLDLTEEAEAELTLHGDPDEAAWVRNGPDASDTAVDGIPEYSLGMHNRQGRAPIRDFARGRAETDRGSAAFERMPQLAVVSTTRDGPADWLAAGQAMQRVLLLATQEGLATSFATQAVERPDLRWLLRDPAGAAGPTQMLLRLGYGPLGPRTPRRPLRDVLHTDP